MVQLRISAVHEFGLAIVNRYVSDVDVVACEKIEPELRFAAANIGNRRALAPLIAAASARVDHFLVTKVARLDWSVQFFERPRRNGQIVYVARDNLENAGLQDEFRIGAVNF